MGLQNWEILLDNPYSTYYAGQTINGQVRLTVDSPKKLRGLIIRILGEANTTWSETKKVKDAEGKEHDEEEWLTGHEEYFENHFHLLGAKNGPEITLPGGVHTYPFTCVLPHNLPSSFEGQYGHIRYTIKVTMDRPWKFDQDAKMAFTVISPIDLNQNPGLKETFKLELEKTFCCFCCQSGPLSSIVSIPARGYVSGQTIPITIEIDNASNVKVNRVRVLVRKVVVFKTNTPRRDTKREKTTIAEIGVGPVEAHGSNTWLKNVDIPPLPPSNLANCGIIDLDYDLKVECNVSGAHTDLDGKIPLVLGTIPLVSTTPAGTVPYTDKPPMQQSPSAQQPSGLPTTNGNGNMAGWNLNALYPNLAQPSFTQSDFHANIVDKSDTQHTMMTTGGNQFAPMYPTYNAAALPPLPNTHQ